MPKENMPDNKKVPPAPLFILNDLFTQYYRKIRYAKREKRLIAWTTIGIPKNIFFAMNIIPVYPQFHAAFQSSRGKAKHIFRKIEGKYEIPHDICGEVKSMMGTILSGERLSFGLPEPNLVISGNGACGAAAKGLEFLSRYLNVPLFFCDFPFVSTDRAEEHALEYVNRQLEEIIKSIEVAYDTEFDKEEYHRLMENEYKALIVWGEILKLCAHDPAPVNAMDLYLFFMPFIILEPDDDAFLELLIKLYNDLFNSCKKNDSCLERSNNNTEIRLLWDILPVYHKMNFFKKIFQDYNANVVMSTYLVGNSFYPESMNLKFNYPLDKRQVINALKNTSMNKIEKYQNIFLEQDANRPIEQRKKLIKNIIRDFNIQGVIMHMDRTCRPMSLPQYDLMKYIQESLNVPAMLFNADSMDERYFSESQISTRLEAFLEGLKSNRR